MMTSVEAEGGESKEHMINNWKAKKVCRIEEKLAWALPFWQSLLSNRSHILRRVLA